MAGFVDVVLRGLILVLTSVALGGVVWLRVVLRAEPYVKPDVPIAVALRAIAVAAAGAALAQAAIVLVGLGAIAHAHGTWPVAAFFETTFALTATAQVMLAATVAVLAAAMTRRAASGAMWTALMAAATLLVASSAIVSHAVARVEWRAALVALDAAHQLAVAVWVGGLAHLVLYGIADERPGETEPHRVWNRPPAVRAMLAVPATTSGSDTSDRSFAIANSTKCARPPTQSAAATWCTASSVASVTRHSSRATAWLTTADDATSSVALAVSAVQSTRDAARRAIVRASALTIAARMMRAVAVSANVVSKNGPSGHVP